jgi:hypothetical protein
MTTVIVPRLKGDPTRAAVQRAADGTATVTLDGQQWRIDPDGSVSR